MKKRYDEFRTRDAEVVAVSFTPPTRVAAYLRRYPLPFRAVSDPDRSAYQAFSMGKVSWPTMMRLDVIGRYLLLMLRGWMPQGPQEDMQQLGGDFVLDHERRLIYAYRSREPTDRPSVEELLTAVGAE